MSTSQKKDQSKPNQNLINLLDQGTLADTPLRDYSGLGTVSDLGLSNEQLKEAVDIMWDIVMVMGREQREEKYLPKAGLEWSVKIFEEDKMKFPKMKDEDAANFLRQQHILGEKIKNIKPLVDVLVKLKNVL